MPAYGSDDSPHEVGGHRPGNSDYLFRGISQTDNHPALQGSLEYGYEPWGAYVGTWASSVNTMTSDGEIEPVACGANLRPPGSPGTRVPCTTTIRGTLEPEKDYVDPKLGLSHEFAGLPLMPRVSASVIRPISRRARN